MTISFLFNPYSFYLFIFLTELTRICSIVMNTRSNSGHPCFVPDLQGDIISMSTLTIIFAAVCVRMYV